MTSKSGSAKGRHGKNTQMSGGAKGAASKATSVMGPATGGRLGNKLNGGFIAGRKAKGKA